MSRSGPKDFSFIGFLRVTRFKNLLIIAFTQYFTAIFLIGPRDQWKQYLLDLNLAIICLGTTLIAAAGYLINDYYDIKIDLINKPEEVVVGTIMKRRVAMIFHTIFNFAGIAGGLYIGIRIGAVNFISALFLWIYSNQLKRLPFIGNFVVAILTGMAVFVVAIFYRENYSVVILYSFFAFLVTLGREIIKDIEDMHGDELFGSKTLPIILGMRNTKLIIHVLSGIFVAFNIYLMAGSKFPGSNIVLMTFIILITVLNYILYRSDTKKDFHTLSQYAKYFMILGVLSMFFIGI